MTTYNFPYPFDYKSIHNVIAKTQVQSKFFIISIDDNALFMNSFATSITFQELYKLDIKQLIHDIINNFNITSMKTLSITIL